MNLYKYWETQIEEEVDIVVSSQRPQSNLTYTIS